MLRAEGPLSDLSATPSQRTAGTASWVTSPRAFLAPLALAQFICSFAGSNMNVMINDISHDLHTDVKGVQTAITLFLVVMAALMIPCGKLPTALAASGCFTGWLVLRGRRGAQRGRTRTRRADLGQLDFRGRRHRGLIPPVYILTTMAVHPT